MPPVRTNWRAGINTLPQVRMRCAKPRAVCSWRGRRVLADPGDPRHRAPWDVCPKCGGPLARVVKPLPGQSKLANLEPIP